MLRILLVFLRFLCISYMIGLPWLWDTVNTQKNMLYSIKNCHIKPLPPHNGHLSTTATFFCPKAAIVERFDFIIESTVIFSIYRVFFMTSRPPYCCPKTMKRPPCWCLKPILWELNPFILLKLIFAPINLYLIFRTRDWICSMRPTKVQDRDCRKATWPLLKTLQ